MQSAKTKSLAGCESEVEARGATVRPWPNTNGFWGLQTEGHQTGKLEELVEAAGVGINMCADSIQVITLNGAQKAQNGEIAVSTHVIHTQILSSS